MLTASGSIESDDVSKTGLVLRASGSIESDDLSMAGLVLRASVVLKVMIFLWRALCLELQ